MEDAREKDTETLKSQLEKLIISKQEINTALAEKSALLKTLEKLPYTNWDAAKAAHDKALNEAEKILGAINKAREEKDAADKKESEISSSINTLNNTLSRLKEDTDKLHKIFTEVLTAQKFVNEDKFLEYIASEEDIAASNNKVNEYNQMVETNMVYAWDFVRKRLTDTLVLSSQHLHIPSIAPVR